MAGRYERESGDTRRQKSVTLHLHDSAMPVFNKHTYHAPLLDGGARLSTPQSRDGSGITKPLTPHEHALFPQLYELYYELSDLLQHPRALRQVVQFARVTHNNPMATVDNVRRLLYLLPPTVFPLTWSGNQIVVSFKRMADHEIRKAITEGLGRLGHITEVTQVPKVAMPAPASRATVSFASRRNARRSGSTESPFVVARDPIPTNSESPVLLLVDDHAENPAHKTHARLMQEVSARAHIRKALRVQLEKTANTTQPIEFDDLCGTIAAMTSIQPQTVFAEARSLIACTPGVEIEGGPAGVDATPSPEIVIVRNIGLALEGLRRR
ncbi:hypothetical protein J8273_7749 [Carpediemonas membranifera]|uniref:Uncharacterized protein n=1 Tax=Carpediemonas membranifera TaxID=201153 RepID=A0A8J6DXL7_9EUKA|nr:hypothetical protein J8273_7749 [Carpediemonas membranifera]|eukprot:KAG9390399.1 hypothetical protein J8273_7749 [Carpediemonas membranifera]